MLSIQSASIVATGKSHQTVLLQSRAIESRCFVIAAAPMGSRDQKRIMYGHSMIDSP